MERNDAVQSDVIELGAVSIETKGLVGQTADYALGQDEPGLRIDWCPWRAASQAARHRPWGSQNIRDIRAV